MNSEEMATAKKPCKCLEQCNKELAKDGLEVDSVFGLNTSDKTVTSQWQIPLRKTAKSRKPIPTMFVTYCPVCGTKQ